LPTNKALLAIDAGQTGIRSVLELDGKKITKDFDGLRTHLELFPQLADVVSGALGAAEINKSEPVVVAIGMTGLTKTNSKPEQLLHILDDQVHSLYLAHDSVSGFLGSIGLVTGVMTAVGTGVVTMGVGATKCARVDGWGNLIGDAGSAYWIGRAGLEAGMKSFDGRAPESALLEIVTKNFPNPEDAYIELQTDEDRVSRIASFARSVIEAADSDAAAREIVLQAARELALSAVTAARLTEIDTEAAPRFSWAGNVMQAKLLREEFANAIKKSLPSAQVIEPIGQPIDGVALLIQIPTDSPLRELVFIANRS
jgi:N-acetylglucosamine kinase-like BadF-type ATPase